jgi:hypothetical protein
LEQPQVIKFWRDFFSDLFLGTFKKLFIFSLLGFALGMALLAVFKWWALDGNDWSGWLNFLVLILTFFWFGVWGTIHGIAYSVLSVGWKKLSQMLEGLHGLLDVLTRGVMQRFPKLGKDIPKEKLTERFDQVGKDFLNKLRLKKGLVSFAASILFGMILKSLKFFFLDDVVLELRQKASGPVSSSDIEHAVRRVGVEKMTEPISDTFILFHLLNLGLMILLLGLPFLILWAL